MGLDTKLNLNNFKFEQWSGDTLNLTGTTVIFGDLKYGVDRSGTFNRFSIVNQSYVTGLTSSVISSSLIANNGIVKNGSAIRLGGSLTGDTNINNSSNQQFLTLLGAGRLGIGTSTPSARAEIQGTTSNSSASALIIRKSDTSQILSIRNDGNTIIDTGLANLNVGNSGNITNVISTTFQITKSNADHSNVLVDIFSNDSITTGQTLFQIRNLTGNYFQLDHNALITVSGNITKSGSQPLIITTAAGKGVQYGADYSSGFTNLSLVTKKFVTGITSTFSANNGIVLGANNNFRLGGSLTGNTSILLNNKSLTFSGSSGGITLTQHSGGIYIKDKGQGGLYMDSGTPSIVGNVIDLTSWEGDGNSSHRTRLRVNNSLIDLYSRANISLNAETSTVISNVAGSSSIDMSSSGNLLYSSSGLGGWKYGADYSSGFTSLSLVTKKFVTGTTYLSANNGITFSGNRFVLGGSLTGNTTLSLGSSNLVISENSSGVLEINSTTPTLRFNNGSSQPLIQQVGTNTLYTSTRWNVANTVYVNPPTSSTTAGARIQIGANNGGIGLKIEKDVTTYLDAYQVADSSNNVIHFANAEVAQTTVTAVHTTGSLTISGTSTSTFPSAGYAALSSNGVIAEIFKYTGVTSTTFRGCTRAQFGTTATAFNTSWVISKLNYMSAISSTLPMIYGTRAGSGNAFVYKNIYTPDQLNFGGSIINMGGGSTNGGTITFTNFSTSTNNSARIIGDGNNNTLKQIFTGGILLSGSGSDTQTSTTRLDVRGVSNVGIIARFATTGNTAIFTLADNGSFDHTGTWTATANNQYHGNFGGTFTPRSGNADNLNAYKFTPSMTANFNGQILRAVYINPTMSNGGQGVNLHALEVVGNSITTTQTASSYHLGIVAPGSNVLTNGGGNVQLANSAGWSSVSLYGGTNQAIRVEQGSGPYINLYYNTLIHSSQALPTARLEVRGTGSTGATTVLKLTDSAANAKFSVLDNGTTTITGPIDLGTTGVAGKVIFRRSSDGAQGSYIQQTSDFTEFNNSQGTGIRLQAAGNNKVTIGSNYVLIHNASGEAVVSNTKLDVRGIGTTTGTTLRLADSANATKLTVTDNGNVAIVGAGTDSAPGFSFGNSAVSNGSNTGFYYTLNQINFTTAGSSALALQGTTSVWGVWGPSSDYTMQVKGGGSGNSNRTGSGLYIQGGGSTGNGAARDIVFQTSPAGSSGTQANPYVTRVTINGQNGAVSIGTGTTSNTKLDVRGLGTTTGTTLRLANSANATKLTVLDNGNVTFGDGTVSTSMLYTSSTGIQMSGRGLSLNGQAPSAQNIQGAASISTVGGNGSLTFTYASQAQTAGSNTIYNFTTTLNSAAGNASHNVNVTNATLSQTGAQSGTSIANLVLFGWNTTSLPPSLVLYNASSTDVGVTGWGPSTGTNSIRGLLINPKYNTGGGTQTAYGIDYNPTLTSTVGLTNYAIRTASGQILFANSSSDVVTSNTRLDVRGVSNAGTIARFASTGNTARFTVSDLGTTTLTSSSTGSASVLSVNSSTTEHFRVQENGVIRIKDLYTFSNSQAISLFSGRDVTNGFSFGTLNTYDGASTTRHLMLLQPSFGWTSGTNVGSSLLISPTYNIVGGTSTVRGIYYNCTNTALSGTTHYAIQTTSGNILFGNNANETITSSTKLDVRGNVAVSGTSTFGTGTGRVQLLNVAADNIAINFPSNNVGFGLGSGGHLFAQTSSSTGFLITSTGGGTTATSNTRLDVRGAGLSSSSNGLRIANSANTATFIVTNNANISVNNATFGTNAAGVIAIKNGTAPTTSPVDSVQLYAEDVTASSELKVRDEAGNITTLSPHNFSIIPEGPSEEMAWAYYSEKNGKKINVDMLKLARLIEKLTGEKLVYIKE